MSATAPRRARDPQFPAPEAYGAPPPDEGWLRTAPGWLVSFLLHLLILLGATLFYFEQKAEEDPTSYLTRIRAAEPPKVEVKPPPEKKKSDVEAELDLDETVISPGDEAAAQDDGDAGADSPDAGAGDLAASIGVYDPTQAGGGAPWRRPRSAPASAAAKIGKTDPRLELALRWLARHQNADGSWSVTDHVKNCGLRGYRESCAGRGFEGNERYDVGVTGLALLAFLGAGYTPANNALVYSSGDDSQEIGAFRDAGSLLTYGDVVRRACKALLGSQQPDGRLGPDTERFIYNHAIGTLALCEAYGATRLWLLRGAAERAVRFLLDARTPQGRRRYLPGSEESDAAIGGWIVLALHSAVTSGVEVDREVFTGVRAWYEAASVEATIPARFLGDPSWNETRKFFLTGYHGSRDAGNLVFVPGFNEQYAYNPALTAKMVMVVRLIDGKSGPLVERGLETLMAFAPEPWRADDGAGLRHVDFYYWFHALYALFLVVPKEDTRWKRWSETLNESLTSSQNRKGLDGVCREGSWDPVDRWSCEGGRVYATALGAWMIEVIRRFETVPGLEKKLVAIRIDG